MERSIAQAVLDGTLSVLWMDFALWSILDGFQTGNIVHVLFFALNASVAVLYAIRSGPVAVSNSPLSLVIVGLSLFYIFGFEALNADSGLAAEGTALILAGGAISLWASVSLGRSFGIRPAVRTIRVSGPYRWVRHPVYSGFMLMNAGEVLAYPTWTNVGVALTGGALLFWRALLEEQLLQKEPNYAAYMANVPNRFVP